MEAFLRFWHRLQVFIVILTYLLIVETNNNQLKSQTATQSIATFHL